MSTAEHDDDVRTDAQKIAHALECARYLAQAYREAGGTTPRQLARGWDALADALEVLSKPPLQVFQIGEALNSG